MSKKLVLLIEILLISGILFPKDITKVGTTSANFLKIGVGASSMGMGGAAVAVSFDASSIYWNPSLIVDLPGGSFCASYTNWLLDIKHSFVGVTFPVLGLGAIGGFINLLNMGDMRVRTVELPEGTGEYFSASDMAVGVSYARKLTNFFAIGFNFKYIREQIWHCSASSIAIDFGTIYHSDNGRYHIGASVSNFGSKMHFTGRDLRRYYDQDPNASGDNEYIPAELHTDRWDLPLIFRVGLCVDVLKSSMLDLRMAVDAVHPNDNTEYMNLGLEMGLVKVGVLRLGYRSMFMQDSEGGLTLGGGIVWKVRNLKLNINYAYSDFGRLSYTDRIDISVIY